MREPDSGGLASHIASHKGYVSLNEAHALLRTFLDSPERRNLEIAAHNHGSMVDLRLDSVAQCTRVISIGSHCATAGELKRFGLKSASYPFDWIFSSIGMVADCIADNFSAFLDKNYHEPIPLENRRDPNANFCDHVIFRDRYDIKYIFNHTDITTDSGRTYYERCVERFRRVMADGQPTILLNLSGSRQRSEGFERLCSVLDRFPHLRTITIEFCPASDRKLSIEKEIEIGRHSFYIVHSSAGLAATRIESLIDEVFIRDFLAHL